MDSSKHVFLMGTGRSGTTIVNRMLGLHKELWSFKHESQLFSGLPPLVSFIDSEFNADKFDIFEKRLLGHLFKRGSEESYFAGLYEIIDLKDLKELTASLRESLIFNNSREDKIKACAEFSDSIFLSASIKEGKSVWLEKTPRNLIFADKIQDLFPDAKFVNVVRDGRLVAKSILNKKFWPMARSARFVQTKNFGGEINEISALRYWVNLMVVTDIMRQRVGSENWLDVRLEDLSHDLPAFQSRFESFFGVSHDPEFLEKSEMLFDSGSANRKVESDIALGNESDLERMLNHYLDIYGYL